MPALAGAEIGAASPAVAKRRSEPGDIVLIDGFPISKARADALRECSKLEVVRGLQIYRACMTEHVRLE
jgi:hypothetical protein